MCVSPGTSRGRAKRAFTLVEVLIVVVIIGILAALAIPAFLTVLDKARASRAIGDVRAIGIDAMEYEMRTGSFPASLAALNMSSMVDPWGNPYVYVRLGGQGAGSARKDRFLVPINTHFDLYSKGADGGTASALTARASKDDIIWANDGGFVGLAGSY